MASEKFSFGGQCIKYLRRFKKLKELRACGPKVGTEFAPDCLRWSPRRNPVPYENGMSCGALHSEVGPTMLIFLSLAGASADTTFI